jgi:hypothetical protein
MVEFEYSESWHHSPQVRATHCRPALSSTIASHTNSQSIDGWQRTEILVQHTLCSFLRLLPTVKPVAHERVIADRKRLPAPSTRLAQSIQEFGRIIWFFEASEAWADDAAEHSFA